MMGSVFISMLVLSSERTHFDGWGLHLFVRLTLFFHSPKARSNLWLCRKSQVSQVRCPTSYLQKEALTAALSLNAHVTLWHSWHILDVQEDAQLFITACTKYLGLKHMTRWHQSWFFPYKITKCHCSQPQQLRDCNCQCNQSLGPLSYFS